MPCAFSKPAGPLQGHDGEFRGRHVEEHVGARRLELRHLGVEVGVAGFVAGFGDDWDRSGERILETLHVVFAVFVILIEDRDLAARLVGQQILAEDAAFGLIVRLPSHGPRMVDRIVPFGGAGGDEELRHMRVVHVFLDRGIRRGSETLKHEQDAIVLDELARGLDGLLRVVAIVVGDEIDLAAVDAAFGVDLLEVRGDGLADQAVGGGRPAIGHDVADLDLGAARARIVFPLHGWRRRRWWCRAVAAVSDHHAEMRRRIARRDQGLAGAGIVLRLHRSRRGCHAEHGEYECGHDLHACLPQKSALATIARSLPHGSTLAWFASC